MLKKKCFPRVAYLFGQVLFRPAVVFTFFICCLFSLYQIFKFASAFWLSMVLGFNFKSHNINPVFISLLHFEICIVKWNEEIKCQCKELYWPLHFLFSF